MIQTRVKLIHYSLSGELWRIEILVTWLTKIKQRPVSRKVQSSSEEMFGLKAPPPEDGSAWELDYGDSICNTQSCPQKACLMDRYSSWRDHTRTCCWKAEERVAHISSSPQYDGWGQVLWAKLFRLTLLCEQLSSLRLCIMDRRSESNCTPI